MIRLKRKILRLSQPELVQQRERVRRRDGYRCTRCGGLGPIQVHHLKRRSEGGGDELENLTSLCVPCHKILHPERELRWGTKKTSFDTTGSVSSKRSRKP